MSAKLASSNATSTFLLSLSSDNFTENGNGYLGKIKTNFLGTIVNIFSPGLNPSDALEKKQKARELLASIVYETNFFGSSRPRDFKVYILKQGAKYYNLRGAKEGED